MTKTYKDELFAFQHTRSDKKKIRFSTYINTQTTYSGFSKRNVQMISIHLNKHIIDPVEHNDLNGTNIKIYLHLHVKRIFIS